MNNCVISILDEDIRNEARNDSIEKEQYASKLKNFYKENCEPCGTQRCLGVYDEVWREGCKLYKKEFCE